MTRHSIILIIAALSIINTVDGQNVSYGPGYQTIIRNNPGFTGSEGDGTLRLSYLNFYPGNNFNLNSVYVSYDSYFPGIHGGAGFYMADDYLGGIINDIRGGFSYAYHLQAGRNLFINVGLSASCYYRGLNISGVVLPDQIDPLNGSVNQSGEVLTGKNRAAFDIGTGFLVMSGKIIAGVAVLHLTNPDISGTGLQSDRINRQIVINAAGNFQAGPSSKFFFRPMVYGEFESGYFSFGAGSAIENAMFSLSAMLLANSSKSTDLQTGCSFKTGRIMLFYNYKFNIHSSAEMLPLSLLHQAGLSFSLNYVDKRKLINAINFPKL